MITVESLGDFAFAVGCGLIAVLAVKAGWYFCASFYCVLAIEFAVSSALASHDYRRKP